MTWRHIMDISPRYNASTLVIGSRAAMQGWPGNEANGFEDDSIELETGTVFVFDLNLLQPMVFVEGDAIKLLASFTNTGSRGAQPEVLAAALAQPVDEEEELGTFEVTDGALVLMNADHAIAGTDPERLVLPATTPTEPTAAHRSMLVVPAANGTWRISAPVKIPAAFGTFTAALALIIRRQA